ncbi:MAG: peptide ABC transporter substrate-binding protein [Anaerolineae bacterium]|nr:peptide ABC transporter substrate-binding protein [Anaerolineae bacterium]
MYNAGKLVRSLLLAASVLAASVVPSMAQAATADSVFPLTSPLLQNTEPITNYAASNSTISYLDPARAEDLPSINLIENLFLGLTDVDPVTIQIRPELATEWSSNEAGDVWTFKLRSDVPWVRYDPATKQTTEIRKVVAGDIVYGVKRSCDPRLGAYYTLVTAAIIKGCDVVSRIESDKIKPEDFDQVGVSAPDDTTLVIETQGALGYFLQTTPMWMIRAVPHEAIEEFGEDWTNAGNIISNGPFVLEQWDKEVSWTFVKNPLYPTINEDAKGNLERLITIYVQESSTLYNLYLGNNIDAAAVPRAEVANAKADPVLSKELSQTIGLGTYYFGFAYDKPPFDKPEVRRAFSAALDRNSYVNEVRQGLGIPIAHFMPPGVFGAVPINVAWIGTEENSGFDPEYAKAQLAAGGYPNCEGLPQVTILSTQSSTSVASAEFMQNAIVQNLGCDVSLITLEQQEFSILLKSTSADTPTEQRPSMWFISWFADYADGQNWMHDVLSCNVGNDFKRTCTPVDDEIDAAAKELDLAKREKMYNDIEESFFGKEGEFPILPIYVSMSLTLYKPWYKGPFETDATFGGPHWEYYTIDQAAQLAARGGANLGLPTPTPLPTETPDPNATPSS